MTPNDKKQDQKIQELEDRIMFLESFLLGTGDDIRFNSNVRKAVVLSEHSAGKPRIISANRKIYNLEIV